VRISTIFRVAYTFSLVYVIYQGHLKLTIIQRNNKFRSYYNKTKSKPMIRFVRSAIRDMHVLRTEGGHAWDVKGPPSCAPTINHSYA